MNHEFKLLEESMGENLQDLELCRVLSHNTKHHDPQMKKKW